MPFDKDTGKTTIDFGNQEDYGTLTADFLLKKMKKDKSIVAVTPAMPTTIGLTQEKRKQAGNQFIDCGIAEEQAIALISGIAKNGGKPILGTNSTFIQRTYDQISQDLCINNNPATIVLNYTSVFGLTDVTHLGIFTIAAFNSIPNLVMLAPTNKQEYMAMLEWSIEQQSHPVMILMPGNGVIQDTRIADKNYDNINKFKIEQNGEKVAIFALGDFYQLGEKICNQIEKNLGFKPTLVNPRFASGIDKELLTSLEKNHQLVITLEDGIIDGAFGTNIASFYGTSNMKVKNYGIEKSFPDRYNPQKLLEENGISEKQILEYIQKTII